ncbi:MAG: 1-acyl-sn-glycerol-3-phosphate acyltransferase [Chloroflexi bacterium]|nr:1-acyl-sn-glycerol-3-phosphate acyltransferase [Chloroflexota bacterium]
MGDEASLGPERPRPPAPAQARRARPARRGAQLARLSPEALAAARGGVREGLAWLGRPPESRAGLLVRLVALLARFLLFGVFRFRVTTSGREHLPPKGGYLVVAAVHRGWMDPFLILHALPLEPRAWFLGSGPSAFSARWREWLLHRIGGMLPVWRGGVGIDQHVASARAVLANGGVFVLVPEGGVTGPPDRLAPFRTGAALIALRVGAPIVPIAIAGSSELYVGRRMASRILPATSAPELLGAAWPGSLPEPGSREELDLAHRLTDRFADVLGPVVAELAPQTVDPPGRPRRLRGLTWLFLSRHAAAAHSREGVG